MEELLRLGIQLLSKQEDYEEAIGEINSPNYRWMRLRYVKNRTAIDAVIDTPKYCWRAYVYITERDDGAYSLVIVDKYGNRKRWDAKEREVLRRYNFTLEGNRKAEHTYR